MVHSTYTRPSTLESALHVLVSSWAWDTYLLYGWRDWGFAALLTCSSVDVTVETKVPGSSTYDYEENIVRVHWRKMLFLQTERDDAGSGKISRRRCYLMWASKHKQASTRKRGAVQGHETQKTQGLTSPHTGLCESLRAKAIAVLLGHLRIVRS